MKPGLMVRMDGWARHLLPVGLTLILMLFSLAPSRVPSLSGVMPQVTIIAVFYWAIYRPDLLSAALAFLLGLIHDLVAGTPLGVSSLVLLFVHAVASSQRRFLLGNPFVFVWWAFSIVAAMALLISWVAASLVHGTIGFRPLMFQYLLTLALYPLVSWILARLHVALLRDS